MVSNQDINKHREPGCYAVLQDKKYYEAGNSFIKRTLRRHEWIIADNPKFAPAANMPQRWTTDAAVLTYLRDKTNIRCRVSSSPLRTTAPSTLAPS